MLFNSYEFLLIFLPVALCGYFAIGNRSVSWAAGWLTLTSLGFYAWWDARYLVLLIGSTAFNFLAGRAIGHAQVLNRPRAKALLACAVAVDLLTLGYYKYAGFFLANFRAIVGGDSGPLDIVLPLGISFFTFTQIAYLVDAFAGRVRDYRFVHYALFVTYFPHLIAGPILHHGEMIRQFDDAKIYRPRRENFEVGCSIFAIGLAKKVLIADTLAPYANALFGSPYDATLVSAWGVYLRTRFSCTLTSRDTATWQSASHAYLEFSCQSISTRLTKPRASSIFGAGGTSRYPGSFVITCTYHWVATRGVCRVGMRIYLRPCCLVVCGTGLGGRSSSGVRCTAFT